MISSLRQLRHFEALYRTGSFIAAARDQAVSQSTLSKSIQQLESTLTAPLFDRTTRTVHPTEFAQRLIPYASEIIAQADNMSQEVDFLQNKQRGRIAIGCGPYPMQPLLTRAVTSFARTNPQITVSLEADDQQTMLDKLITRQLDLIVCDASKYEVSAHIEQIQRIPIAPDTVVVVLHPEHPLNNETLDFSNLVKYRWAAPSSSPHFLRKMTSPQGAGSSGGGHPQFRLNSVAACVDLARTGDVLAIVPRAYAEEACKSGEFRWLQPVRPVKTNDAIHFLKGRTFGPSVREMIEIIQHTADEVNNAPCTT